MKNLLLLSMVILSSTYGATVANAGGGKALDAYKGEYVSNGAPNCAYNLEVEKWDLKTGHVIRFGTLQGKIPVDAFSKEGYMECKKQGTDKDKLCTKVLAVKTERKDKKGNDLPPKITISEGKYFVKNGNEKRSQVIEKLSPKMILEDKGGKIHFTSLLAPEKVSCIYSKSNAGSKSDAYASRVQSSGRNVKRAPATAPAPAAFNPMQPAQ